MALQENKMRRHTIKPEPRLVALPVKAGAVIWEGAGVVLDNGFAVPAQDVAGVTWAGVAWTGLDNSAGADGCLLPEPAVRYVEVESDRAWSFEFAGTPPVAGQVAYVVDDDVLTVDATANNLRAGVVTQPDTQTNHFFVDVRS